MTLNSKTVTHLPTYKCFWLEHSPATMTSKTEWKTINFLMMIRLKPFLLAHAKSFLSSCFLSLQLPFLFLTAKKLRAIFNNSLCITLSPSLPSHANIIKWDFYFFLVHSPVTNCHSMYTRNPLFLLSKHLGNNIFFSYTINCFSKHAHIVNFKHA